MKTFTTEERRKIYLAVAKKIASNITGTNYVCLHLERESGCDSFNGLNEEAFPEFFLFKDFDNRAWLSHPKDWEVGENNQWDDAAIRQAVSENKLTVLFLCAEMCK